jgi:hypothetical protein
MQSKYKSVRAVLNSLRSGTSIVAACKGVGIEPSTLWRWRKAKPKLNQLIQSIIDSRIQIVEDALFKSATEGNTTSIIFFLTNRAPDRWADKRAVVNNMIVNRVGGNGSFTGEDREFTDRIRKELFGEVPQK